MAKTLPPSGSENIFAPPEDGKLEDVSTPQPFAAPQAEAPKEEKRYDIPFQQHENLVLEGLLRLAEVELSIHAAGKNSG